MLWNGLVSGLSISMLGKTQLVSFDGCNSEIIDVKVDIFIFTENHILGYCDFFSSKLVESCWVFFTSKVALYLYKSVNVTSILAWNTAVMPGLGMWVCYDGYMRALAAFLNLNSSPNYNQLKSFL